MDIAPIPRDIGAYKWKNPSFVVPIKPASMDKLYKAQGGASLGGIGLVVLTFVVMGFLIFVGLVQYPLIFFDVLGTFWEELKFARYNQYQKKVHDIAAITNKKDYRKHWEKALSDYGSFAATSTYWVYYNHMDEGKTWFDYYFEDDTKLKKRNNSEQTNGLNKYTVPELDDVNRVIKQKKDFATKGEKNESPPDIEKIRYTQVALLQMMRNELNRNGSQLYNPGDLPSDKFLMKYG